MPAATTKQQLLNQLQQERAIWQELLAEIGQGFDQRLGAVHFGSAHGKEKVAKKAKITVRKIKAIKKWLFLIQNATMSPVGMSKMPVFSSKSRTERDTISENNGF